MPIYSYSCDCGETFDKFYATMSQASRYIDKSICSCGKTAVRVLSVPKVFFKNSADGPMFSSPSDFNKE